jgi:hypothetical protein
MEDVVAQYGGDWVKVSQHKYLTEDFIRKHEDKVNWGWICKKAATQRSVY